MLRVHTLFVGTPIIRSSGIKRCLSVKTLLINVVPEYCTFIEIFILSWEFIIVICRISIRICVMSSTVRPVGAVYWRYIGRKWIGRDLSKWIGIRRQSSSKGRIRVVRIWINSKLRQVRRTVIAISTVGLIWLEMRKGYARLVQMWRGICPSYLSMLNLSPCRCGSGKCCDVCLGVYIR